MKIKCKAAGEWVKEKEYKLATLLAFTTVVGFQKDPGYSFVMRVTIILNGTKKRPSVAAELILAAACKFHNTKKIYTEA